MSKPSTKGFWELLRNSLADEELPFKPVQAYLNLLGPVQLPKKRHVFLAFKPVPVHYMEKNRTCSNPIKHALKNRSQSVREGNILWRLYRKRGVHDEENPFCTKKRHSGRSILRVLGFARQILWFLGHQVCMYVYIYTHIYIFTICMYTHIYIYIQIHICRDVAPSTVMSVCAMACMLYMCRSPFQ